MVDFITESPFTRRFQQNQAASQRREFRDFRIENERSEADARERERRQAADIDRVTRETVRTQSNQQPQTQQAEGVLNPPQNRAATQPARQAPAQQQRGFRSRLAQNLSGVQGGGAAAAELTLSDLDRQQKIMERTFDLAVNDPEMALVWAEQQGMPVPPQLQNLIRNNQVSTAIANGMKRINEVYGTGAAQAERRWQAMQLLLKGIDEQAQQSGGIPSAMQQGVVQGLPEPAAAPSEAPTVRTVFDPKTGREINMQWNGTEWVPLGGVESPETARGRQGQPPAAVQTAEWLASTTARSEGRSVTDQDRVAAFAQVQQAKENPVARANLVARVFDAMVKDFTDARPTAEKQSAAQAWVNQLMGGSPAPEAAAPDETSAATTMQGPDGGQHPVVSNETEYNALPPGAIYYHAGRQTFMRKGG